MSGSEQGLEGLSQQSLENLAIGKTKKEEADAAFKAGNIKDGVFWICFEFVEAEIDEEVVGVRGSFETLSWGLFFPCYTAAMPNLFV